MRDWHSIDTSFGDGEGGCGINNGGFGDMSAFFEFAVSSIAATQIANARDIRGTGLCGRDDGSGFSGADNTVHVESIMELLNA